MGHESTEILTIKEAAEYLKVSIPQAYRFIERKDNPLPVIYVSDRSSRVRMSDLQDWLDTMKGGEQ